MDTYCKYNEGSLCGLWVDLSSFDDYDEFINFCCASHAYEEDPELMAQDYECFPRLWYNENFMTLEDFDNIKECSEMCDHHSTEAVDNYMEFHDSLENLRKPTAANGIPKKTSPVISSTKLTIFKS